MLVLLVKYFYLFELFLPIFLLLLDWTSCRLLMDWTAIVNLGLALISTTLSFLLHFEVSLLFESAEVSLRSPSVRLMLERLVMSWKLLSSIWFLNNGYLLTPPLAEEYAEIALFFLVRRVRLTCCITIAVLSADVFKLLKNSYCPL
jgi:hypothetical protein